MKSRYYDAVVLFQNTFILRSPGVAIFADIIKAATMFFKTDLVRLRQKFKKIYKLCIKMQFLYAFLDITKVASFWSKNADAGRAKLVCHVIFIIFLIFFR